jgi:molybdenum cofactor cytidylyltransferase
VTQRSGIEAVVLAAGASRRAGKDNKLLYRLDGESLVVRAARAGLSSRCDRVIVVTGFDAQEVEAQLRGLDVMVARNSDYSSGMASSLRCGLKRADRSSQAVLILLADMPWVKGPVDHRAHARRSARQSGTLAEEVLR